MPIGSSANKGLMGKKKNHQVTGPHSASDHQEWSDGNYTPPSLLSDFGYKWCPLYNMTYIHIFLAFNSNLQISRYNNQSIIDKLKETAGISDFVTLLVVVFFCLQVSSTIKCFSPASAMFGTHHAWSVQTATLALLNAPLSSVNLKLTDWTEHSLYAVAITGIRS